MTPPDPSAHAHPYRSRAPDARPEGPSHTSGLNGSVLVAQVAVVVWCGVRFATDALSRTTSFEGLGALVLAIFLGRAVMRRALGRP